MCFHWCNNSHEHYLEFWKLWYDSVCACLFPRVHAETKSGPWVPPPLLSTFTALRQSFSEPLQRGWLAGKLLGSASLHPHPCWGYRGMPAMLSFLHGCWEFKLCLRLQFSVLFPSPEKVHFKECQGIQRSKGLRSNYLIFP